MVIREGWRPAVLAGLLEWVPGGPLWHLTVLYVLLVTVAITQLKR